MKKLTHLERELISALEGLVYYAEAFAKSESSNAAKMHAKDALALVAKARGE